MENMTRKEKTAELKVQLQQVERDLAAAEESEQRAERTYCATPTEANGSACLAAADARKLAGIRVLRKKQELEELGRSQVVSMLPQRARRYPFTFGDDATRDAWLERCALQLRTQRGRYSVAPDTGIVLPSGLTVRAGMVVSASDFAGHPTKSPTVLLEEYVVSGHLLDKGDSGYSAA